MPLLATAQRRPVLLVPDDREVSFLSDCLRRETLGGGLALAAAVVAVLWANSRWGEGYVDLQYLVIGPLDLEHWAADGALTLFFFVAGLGIGFTVSLLVSDLTFDGEALVAAKTAVLAASMVSGLLGGVLLYHRGRARINTPSLDAPDRLA